jgi:hypothetical protein
LKGIDHEGADGIREFLHDTMGACGCVANCTYGFCHGLDSLDSPDEPRSTLEGSDRFMALSAALLPNNRGL